MQIKIVPLSPFQTIRICDAHTFFGLRPTQLWEGIKRGEIPEPKHLTGGRARGFTGQQIIDWHQANDAAQAERAAKSRKRSEVRTAKSQATKAAKVATKDTKLRRSKVGA